MAGGIWRVDVCVCEMFPRRRRPAEGPVPVRGFIGAKVEVFKGIDMEYFPEIEVMFRKKAAFCLCATVCCVAEHMNLFAGGSSEGYLCSTLDT